MEQSLKEQLDLMGMTEAHNLTVQINETCKAAHLSNLEVIAAVGSHLYAMLKAAPIGLQEEPEVTVILPTLERFLLRLCLTQQYGLVEETLNKLEGR